MKKTIDNDLLICVKTFILGSVTLLALAAVIYYLRLPLFRTKTMGNYMHRSANNFSNTFITSSQLIATTTPNENNHPNESNTRKFPFDIANPGLFTFAQSGISSHLLVSRQDSDTSVNSSSRFSKYRTAVCISGQLRSYVMRPSHPHFPANFSPMTTKFKTENMMWQRQYNEICIHHSETLTYLQLEVKMNRK